MLQHAKTVIPGMVTKSSIMLGMGESDVEVLQTLKGTIVFPHVWLFMVCLQTYGQLVWIV